MSRLWEAQVEKEAAGRGAGDNQRVMSAVAEGRISLDEFHRRFAGGKPYFEFWDGEAVQKATTTRLHSLIQKILVQWLDALGYEAGQEITIKLDPSYEPIPAVIARRGDRVISARQLWDEVDRRLPGLGLARASGLKRPC